MACEILEFCKFFKDKMKDLPRTAEYLKDKLCLGNYESCNRFRIFKELGVESIPHDLVPQIVEPKSDWPEESHGN